MDRTLSFASSWRRKTQQADEAYHDRKPIRKITPQDRNWGASLDVKSDEVPMVKRWDGKRQKAEHWDNLKCDPDLFFEDGNCAIHLHAPNTSKRGPSLKVPLAALITADCAPLIARFMPRDPHNPAPRSPREIKKFLRSFNKKSQIDLFIAPSQTRMSCKEEVFRYHVATRNFFAWVFRQPLVGAHLGQAMVGLLNSMHEFRDGMGDNVADMVEYLEYIGYGQISNSPDHALAMLHFANHFQMRDLYVRAVAHCVGMFAQLPDSSEWLHLDKGLKKTLRAVHLDLQSRIHRASSMLKNFLDDELSESYIGLPGGARSHLERFRGFLIAYYSGQLGYFPPKTFDSDLLRMMREDFEALYDLLVDTEYSVDDSMPAIAVGGICTLQAVNDFDLAMGMDTLEHPLPLLPHVASTSKQRRLSRIISRSNLRQQPDSRLLTHTALIKATNWKDASFRNPLVQAYRKFEEISILDPAKRSSKEKVSLVDARKVRWVMVYGVYQILKSVTDEPACVREDNDCDYHLAINENLIPTWRQKKSLGLLVRSQTDMVARCSSLAGTPDTLGWRASAQLKAEAPLVEEDEEKIEIEPDVDYFALTHKSADGSPLEVSRTKSGGKGSRSNSFSRALSLKNNATLRRSMMFFKTSVAPPAIPAVFDSEKAPKGDDEKATRVANQAIAADRDSNEISSSEQKAEETQSPQQESIGSWASRSDSTASKGTSATHQSSEADSSGSDEVNDLPAQTTIPEALEEERRDLEREQLGRVQWDAMPQPLKLQGKRRDVVSMIMPTPNRRASLRRPLSGVFDMAAINTSFNTDIPTNNFYGTQTICYSPNAQPSTSYSPSSSPIETTFEASLPRSNSFSFTNTLSRSNSFSISRNNSSFGLSRSNSLLMKTAALRKTFTEKGKESDNRRISEDFEVVMDERDEWGQMQNWLGTGDQGKAEKEEESEEDLVMGGGKGKEKTAAHKGDAWGDYAELGGLTETK